MTAIVIITCHHKHKASHKHKARLITKPHVSTVYKVAKFVAIIKKQLIFKFSISDPYLMCNERKMLYRQKKVISQNLHKFNNFAFLVTIIGI